MCWAAQHPGALCCRSRRRPHDGSEVCWRSRSQLLPPPAVHETRWARPLPPTAGRLVGIDIVTNLSLSAAPTLAMPQALVPVFSPQASHCFLAFSSGRFCRQSDRFRVHNDLVGAWLNNANRVLVLWRASANVTKCGVAPIVSDRPEAMQLARCHVVHCLARTCTGKLPLTGGRHACRRSSDGCSQGHAHDILRSQISASPSESRPRLTQLLC